MNTLRVDGEIFESGKKTLWILKYPDTCRRGMHCKIIVINNDVTVIHLKKKKIHIREERRDNDFVIFIKIKLNFRIPGH